MRSPTQRWAACVVAVAGVAACTTPASERARSDDADASPSGRCRLTDGLHRIDVAGQAREFVVRRGSRMGPGPGPVVLIWHGFGGFGASVVSLIDDAEWPEALRVAPKGLPRTFEKFGDVPRLGWQIRRDEYEGRDLAFFDALLSRLENEGCLARGQAFTTGFSNGGFFSNLLACHRAEDLAAAAPVGGGGPFEPCEGVVPMLIHHGTADRVVPFELAERSYQTWKKQHGCTAGVPKDEGCVRSEECTIQFCSVAIGHRWPRGASGRIAKFFKGVAASGRR